jgi:hypothetical protein
MEVGHLKEAPTLLVATDIAVERPKAHPYQDTMAWKADLRAG